MCQFKGALEPRFSVLEAETTEFRDFPEKRDLRLVLRNSVPGVSVVHSAELGTFFPMY